jgi:putative ABC transport system substrate-binding protein
MAAWDVPAEARYVVVAVEDAARRLAIPVRKVDLGGVDAAQADRVLASLHGEGVRVFAHWSTIAGVPDEDVALLFATKYRLVTLADSDEDVARGTLLTYAVADEDTIERKALQLVKVLRGASPADLPFDMPSRFRLLVNRRTARLLGLTIPREILLAADKVYE